MAVKTIYKSEEGKRDILALYEKYLDSFQYELERLTIDTSYGKTHLLVGGPEDGKPLFILHGGNSINPMTLSWFMPLFSQYRIYAPDILGHPGYSAERMLAASDSSFPKWIAELMDALHVEKSAFAGASYGAGIILRMAAYMPERIICSILVSPAGISLGSKVAMIKDILIPLIAFKLTSSDTYLHKITESMSLNSMKEIDREIIGRIFKSVKLEHEMPKITEKKELLDYHAPTMIVAGSKDIFFPDKKIKNAAAEIFNPILTYKSYEMGHFPSESLLDEINKEMKAFLHSYY